MTQHYGVDDRLAEYNAEMREAASKMTKQFDHEVDHRLGRWGIVIALALLALGLLVFTGENTLSYLMNTFTEFIGFVLGVAITVIIVDRRSERRETERLKQDLVRRASSQSNEFAKDAIDELRDRGWLTGEDGLLKGAKLWGANLRGANLRDANLQGAKLRLARLQGAYLFGAELQEAKLSHAKLQEANLSNAELQGAYLFGANLQGAYLFGANLQGAKLSHAKLQEANLSNAELQGADLKLAKLRGAVVTDFVDRLGNKMLTQLDENTTVPYGFKYNPAQGLAQLEMFGMRVLRFDEEYDAWLEAQHNKGNQ